MIKETDRQQLLAWCEINHTTPTKAVNDWLNDKYCVMFKYLRHYSIVLTNNSALSLVGEGERPSSFFTNIISI